VIDTADTPGLESGVIIGGNADALSMGRRHEWCVVYAAKDMEKHWKTRRQKIEYSP